MDSFSWSDGVQAALSSCLPCFTSRKQEDSSDESDDNSRRTGIRRTHYDELEGLLGDVEETDVDAETMSLHSNIGCGAGQKKKKKKRNTRKKSIKLFGFDLFGRPPIQLPESEDEDGERSTLDPRHRRVGRLLSAANSNSSTSAFDSDAAPLDPASIARLAAQDRDRSVAEFEEERRHQEEREEREERRRKRRERRELRRKAEEMASAAAMGLDDGDFEGFQGSGHGLLHSPFSAASTGSGFTTPSVPGTAAGVDEYGPFVGAIGPTGVGAGADDPADGEADFGGEAYAQKPRRPHGSRGSDSSRSHSVSQTSASVSNTDPAQYNHHYISQQQIAHPYSPLNAQFASSGVKAAVRGTLAEPPRRKKKKRSTASGSVSTGRRSNSPTSQSASLPSVDSPVDTTFGKRFNATEPFIAEQEDEHSARFPSPFGGLQEATLTDSSKFPSVGFGGIRRSNSAGLGAAFLARTGDD